MHNPVNGMPAASGTTFPDSLLPCAHQSVVRLQRLCLTIEETMNRSLQDPNRKDDKYD